MLIAMSFITAVAALGAADLVWRGRGDADLRRRWRTRARQSWRLS